MNIKILTHIPVCVCVQVCLMATSWTDPGIMPRHPRATTMDQVCVCVREREREIVCVCVCMHNVSHIQYITKHMPNLNMCVCVCVIHQAVGAVQSAPPPTVRREVNGRMLTFKYCRTCNIYRYTTLHTHTHVFIV
jgi:hypothetical protein